MIQNFAPTPDNDEARILIRPNRSLTAGQLRWISLGFAAVAAAISWMSWLQGNAFAPLFALIEVGVFVGCLGWVWSRSGRAEIIVINPAQVCVRHLPELTDVFVANPAWVRVDTSSGRLVLYSAGKGIAVGDGLTATERAALSEKVGEFLRWARTLSDSLRRRQAVGTNSNDDVVE